MVCLHGCPRYQIGVPSGVSTDIGKVQLWPTQAGKHSIWLAVRVRGVRPELLVIHGAAAVARDEHKQVISARARKRREDVGLVHVGDERRRTGGGQREVVQHIAQKHG